MLLSQGLLEHRSFALDRYNIPRLPPEYHDHTWKNGHIHQLEIVDKHLYYYMPPGSSVLSVPYVAALNLFGISPRNPDGSYNPFAERTIQVSLAALLMAIFSVVAFYTARLLLPISWSLVVAFGSALGTQVWSTTSRSLWADTWGVLLLSVVAYLMLADGIGKRRLNPFVAATLLAWTYFVRPSNAVVVMAVTVYVMLARRQIFWRYALSGAIWGCVLVVYSWIHYHAVLPTYFRVNQRLSFSHFFTAIAGNLISPSRGLFVFVPITLGILFIVWRHRQTVVSKPLLFLALTVIALYVLVISTFNPWWAGASFGPRYLSPVVPWFVVLAVLGLDALRRSAAAVNQRITLVFAGLLLFLSVTINAFGALSWRAWMWNAHGDIDHDAKKVWSLKYPQLLAPFKRPPLPDQFPAMPELIELSAPDATKYLGYGWSSAEQGFRWTQGEEAIIVFATSNHDDLKMSVSLTPFIVAGRLDHQRLEVFLNASSIKNLELKSDQVEVYEFQLPKALLQKKNIITFRLPDAKSPISFQLSQDDRRLGVAVQWIRFESIGTR